MVCDVYLFQEIGYHRVEKWPVAYIHQKLSKLILAHGVSLNMIMSIPDDHGLILTLYVLNINMHLHFVSFLHIDTTQVVEILSQIRQEPTYST